MSNSHHDSMTGGTKGVAVGEIRTKLKQLEDRKMELMGENEKLEKDIEMMRGALNVMTDIL